MFLLAPPTNGDCIARTGIGVALENLGLEDALEFPTESEKLPPLPNVNPKSYSPIIEL